MPNFTINKKSVHFPISRVLVFMILILVGAFISMPIHEFGHCLFYWAQGIPAGMSLMKEFPLRDISVQEYAIGSVGGILANIFFLFALFFLGLFLHPTYKKIKFIIAALFLGEGINLVLGSVLVLLRNKPMVELSYTEEWLGLPRHAFYWGALVLTIILTILYIRRNRINIRFKELGYFISLIIMFMLIIGITQSFDKTYFWSKYPTIKIGDKIIYNKHK